MTTLPSESARPVAPAADIVFRPMLASDAPACHRLSQAVAWPHRREDWEMMIALGGGVVGMDGGEIVATALHWRYGDRAATLGLIIVDSSRQGLGLGKRLMQQLLAMAGERTLLLNATAAGLQLYARSGFVPCGTVSQYQGLAVAPVSELPGAGERLRAATIAELPVLARLDAQASGLPRRPVLQALLESGDCVMLERDGEPVGFSVLRRFGRGDVIGPVIAPGEREARLLIAPWLAARAGGFVRIDIPAEPSLAQWLVRHGLQPAGDVTAMARGEKPAGTGPAQVFALIGQALG